MNHISAWNEWPDALHGSSEMLWARTSCTILLKVIVLFQKKHQTSKEKARKSAEKCYTSCGGLCTLYGHSRFHEQKYCLHFQSRISPIKLVQYLNQIIRIPQNLSVHHTIHHRLCNLRSTHHFSTVTIDYPSSSLCQLGPTLTSAISCSQNLDCRAQQKF